MRALAPSDVFSKFGTVFSKAEGASSALKKIGGDFQVDKVRLISEDTKSPSPYFIIRRPSISRDEKEAFFGRPVGENYSFYQREELAKLLDPITDDYPLYAAGITGKGERIWWLVDLGAAEIGGDGIQNNLLLVDELGGEGSLKACMTPKKFACANTLRSALSHSSFSIALRHTKSIKEELEWRMQLMGTMAKMKAKSLEELEALTKKKIEAEDQHKILITIYPLPIMPDKQKLEREKKENKVSFYGIPLSLYKYEQETNAMMAIRNSVVKRHERFNDEFVPVANTAWSFYNAVAEEEDHREGNKNSFAAAIFGERARTKEKAFQLVGAV